MLVEKECFGIYHDEFGTINVIYQTQSPSGSFPLTTIGSCTQPGSSMVLSKSASGVLSRLGGWVRWSG